MCQTFSVLQFLKCRNTTLQTKSIKYYGSMYCKTRRVCIYFFFFSLNQSAFERTAIVSHIPVIRLPRILHVAPIRRPLFKIKNAIQTAGNERYKQIHVTELFIGALLWHSTGRPCTQLYIFLILLLRSVIMYLSNTNIPAIHVIIII